MVYAYIRYSTGKQNESEQTVIIDRYCKSHNLVVDKTYEDRGVSGTTQWSSRNLAELVEALQPGDTLIASEASRLSRSMHDFSDFLNIGMRKKKAIVIIANMGLRIDCSSIDAVTELTLYMLTFAAQMERELISTRTKASLKYRRELIEENGGFVSKNGNWCTSLGRRTGQGINKSIRADNYDAWQMAEQLLEEGLSLHAIADEINKANIRTKRGGQWWPQQVKRLLDD